MALKIIKIALTAVLIALLLDFAAWIFRGNSILFYTVFKGKVPFYVG